MRRLVVVLALMASTGSSAESDIVYLVKNRDQTLTVRDTDGDAVTGDIPLPVGDRGVRVVAADDGFHVVAESADWREDRYFRLRAPDYALEPIDARAAHGLTITRDGTKAAYMTGTYEDPSLVLRDLRTGRETATKSTPVYRMTWTPDGSRLLLSIFPPCDDTSDCLGPEQLKFHDSDRLLGSFDYLTAAPVITGGRILVALPDGVIEHYSTTDGRLLDRVRTPFRITQLSVRGDRLLIVVGGNPTRHGGARLVTGPLTGGEWRDLPWDAATMETAAW
ncbi:hypothetical protein FDA94_22285 [Herbidospora galbida]|uniref:WD40 repeat domain-containing protein n=1 Tax=Herbidospora galbida TaxID=2575442 RepID=A0A4U3MB76_9ACTN|nr:hypothetical protein [Herbidospora galbida]TKK86251.1 hypothetical protein FDA94_22285 [Herbidospora galbida]